MVGGGKDREEMRLIDADALYEKLQKDSTYDLDCMDSELREIIDNQPTAFDTEKVVEQLEEKIEITWKHDYRGGRKDAFNEAIDIVKKGGVE